MKKFALSLIATATNACALTLSTESLAEVGKGNPCQNFDGRDGFYLVSLWTKPHAHNRDGADYWGIGMVGILNGELHGGAHYSGTCYDEKEASPLNGKLT